MDNFSEFERPLAPQKDSGSIISHAWENYKGVILYNLAFILLSVLISFFISTFISIFITTDDSTKNALNEIIENISKGKQIDYESISKIQENQSFGATILSFLSSTLFGALIYPLTAGILYINYKYNSKKEINVDDFFIGYRQNTKNIIIYGFLITVVVSGIITLFKLIAGPSFIFSFLAILISIYISIITFLGLPIVFFENALPKDAIKKSMETVNQNFSVIFITLILALLIAFSGFLICCIGIFLTAGFIYSVQYSTYCAYCGTPYEVNKN